ncbi:MAG: polysaccharide deacetylase family protein [Candidatus Doudnabacteria bacterium]|nr:polysaccharide deacetylase family protein [Candidatus Doudnabacteria bacterium]
MNENQLRFGKATAVALLGGLFILGLTPHPAHGLFWQWPFSDNQVAVPQILGVSSEYPEPQAIPEQTIKPNTYSKLVVILMYHHVHELSESERIHNPLLSDLTVSPEDFEAQVEYLYSSGYHSISAADLYKSIAGGTVLPDKAVVFTFDDGYEDVFDNAIPVLKKFGYTGSFAVATALLGRPDYATWDDVLAADASGMEILSHSDNHLDLTSTKYSQDDLKREIYGSKTLLEGNLGHTIDFFVYPYGHQDQKIVNLVSEAGYKMAFTTQFGFWMDPNNLLTEPRVRVHGADGLAKLKKVLPL